MDDKNLHIHEWVVFSTALQEVCLMLQCIECGAIGTVNDPTREEWSEAFHAPIKPYQWTDDARVQFQQEPPCPVHVVRADKKAPRCDCSSHQEAKEYERFPAEIMKLDGPLSQEETTDLEEMAEFVGKSDRCSRFFPLFVQSYKQATGHEHTEAVRTIASRIEEIDRMGMHLSPSVVAKVLKMHAGGQHGTAG